LADFTISVSNSLNVFGAGPSSKWNEHNWGEFNWGEGTEDMIHGIFKFIDNSQSIADTYAFTFNKVVSNSQSLNSALPIQYLIDANGYYYIFTKPTTDAEERSDATWSDADVGDVATWTCQAAGSTTWS